LTGTDWFLFGYLNLLNFIQQTQNSNLKNLKIHKKINLGQKNHKNLKYIKKSFQISSILSNRNESKAIESNLAQLI
jgi:hypothetical protein